MKEKQILAVIKEPGQAPRLEPLFENTLEAFQAAVGGCIETVTLATDLVIICNEEGKLIGLEPNMKIPGDILCGTIIVAGVSGDEFDDVSISFEEWKQLVKEWGN